MFIKKTNLFYLFFALFILCSCATTDDPEFSEADDLEYEEDLLSEEELEAELDKPEEVVEASPEELEEEAEGEIEDIEDEFAEFVEEEEESLEDELNIPESEEIAENQEESQEENDLEAELDIPESEDIAENQEEQTQEEGLGDEGVVDSPIAVESEEELADEGVVDASIAAESEGEPGDDVAAVDETSDETSAPDTTDSPEMVRITNIRYESESIYIDSVGGDLNYRSRFNEANKQFIVEIPKARIVDQLKWPYVMKEFDSSFALLQADQKDEDTVRVVIQMRPEASQPQIVQKDNNQGFIISSSTILTADESDDGSEDLSEDPTEEETISDIADAEADLTEPGDGQILAAQTIEEFLLDKHSYHGHPITLDVRDADLLDILHFLTEDSGINMIISDTVSKQKKKINLKLKQVPWDQVLVTIMKENDLGYIRAGNVVSITTMADIKKKRRDLVSLAEEKQKLAPLDDLVLEIVPIFYSKVSDIASLVTPFKSERGRVTPDQKNNSLLIYDVREYIEDIKKLVVKLDKPEKQVMIAAKIVEVTNRFNQSIGISWGLSGGSPFTIGPLGGLEITANPFLEALPGNPNTGLLGTQLSVGRFEFIGDLDAQFGLAETEGDARVLSSPRIMVRNGQSATVTQSSENITLTSTISEGGGSQPRVERAPVSLNLSVTPEITNSNHVHIQVSMNRSFVGEEQLGGESSARPTNSRTANTNIIVRSGQTAVIGGIYDTEKTNAFRGLPILKYIPIVKWLFSTRTSTNSKNELLLFITPRIVSSDGDSDDVQVSKNLRKT